jgi:D-3-phosphoglycerate dehydrogenase
MAAPAIALLRSLGDLELADVRGAELRDRIAPADILWVRLRSRIDATVFDAAPRLKAVVTPTTGLNHIDVEEAARRGIRILSLRGATEFLRGVRATAEHTLALTLALLRHLPAAVGHAAAGGWNREAYKGREICGKTIGVVGYGRLGRLVARYFQAFDATVLACDPNVEVTAVPRAIERVTLEALVMRADIITLHVSLSPETRLMIGPSHFAAMRPAAWFINTSRGELVDEDALLQALAAGRLAGAALDVLADEDSLGMNQRPIVQYAREHANLILTPHIGGWTYESQEKTELFMAKKLQEFLTSQPNEHIVQRRPTARRGRTGPSRAS